MHMCSSSSSSGCFWSFATLDDFLRPWCVFGGALALGGSAFSTSPSPDPEDSESDESEASSATGLLSSFCLLALPWIGTPLADNIEDWQKSGNDITQTNWLTLNKFKRNWIRQKTFFWWINAVICFFSRSLLPLPSGWVPKNYLKKKSNDIAQFSGFLYPNWIKTDMVALAALWKIPFQKWKRDTICCHQKFVRDIHYKRTTGR